MILCLISHLKLRCYLNLIQNLPLILTNHLQSTHNSKLAKIHPL